MRFLKRLLRLGSRKRQKPIEIVIYSRPGCHLCEIAEKVVRQFESQFDLEVEVVDISTSAELENQYRVEIPVVFVDGKQRFRHRVSPTGLERLLEEIAAESGER